MSGEPPVEVAYSTVAVPQPVPVRVGGLVVRSREYCCLRARLAGGTDGEAFVLTRGLDVAGAVRDLVAPRVLANYTGDSATPAGDRPSGNRAGGSRDGDGWGGGPDGDGWGGEPAGDALRVSLRNTGWDGAISRAAALVSLAVLDARARAAGVPVSWLLGAQTTPEPPAVVVIGYRPARPPVTGDPALAVLTPGSPSPGGTDADVRAAEMAAADAEEAVQAAALGATWLKLVATGGPPDLELARVRRVREAVGPGCQIALDVNGAWSLQTALAALPRLHDAGVAYVEEPWPYELGLAGFAALDGVPHPELAFGEVSASVIELEALAGTGRVRYLRPDATLLGGPAPFARALPAAAAAGCVLVPHFWPEVHRHLVAGYPGPAMLECVPGEAGGLRLDRFVEGTVTVRDGVVVGPDRPGFGYRLDWAGIRYLAGGAPAVLTRGTDR